MSALCLILFTCIAAFWFLSNEYPTLFGIYVPVCAVRRITLKSIVAVTLLAGVLLSGMADVSASILANTGAGSMDCYTLMIVLLSSMIVLTLLKFLSIKGSAVYALLGAMEAEAIVSGHGSGAVLLISFLAAPVMAFVLSFFIRSVFRLTLGRTRIHLLTLSYYLKHAVIVGIIITALALGLNWGGFLMAGTPMSNETPVLTVALVAIAIIVMSSIMREESDENAGVYSEFSIYTVLSISFATALSLLFFSFDASAGLLGLKAVPLSVGSLVFASIAGAELSQRSRVVESESYRNEALGLVLAPAGALLTAYVFLYITGRNEEVMVDFTVLAAGIMVLISLIFMGYVRRQRLQRQNMDRLVYSQQQQIYENSRALNDMQLKVVLSENQALHNAVEMKRQEVMNVALSIMEQKEYLESLNDLVNRLSKTSDENERADLISELGSSLKQRLSYDRDVDTTYFYAQAESLHEDFNAKLSENFPELTPQERRLATLLRLGFSSKYIATLMNITVKSVEISRYRLRQKLGLGKGDNLVNFIKSI